MKVWKTMVKRIKKVPPHVLDEISYARKYLVGLSIYGTFVSVTQKEGMADKRIRLSAIELDFGVPTA